jgi:hypothetical protein
MKQMFFLVAAFTIMSQTGFSQKSPHDTVTFANGSVTYGRPYKKGRDVFGGLEKFGNVWRLGADQATTITFKSDTKFGGQMIPKGTYTMFALLNEKEWTIILNSQLGQWGAFGYEKVKDKDIAKITVPVKKLDNVVEQLTIRFDKKNNMIIEWDKTQVSVPMSF